MQFNYLRKHTPTKHRSKALQEKEPARSLYSWICHANTLSLLPSKWETGCGQNSELALAVTSWADSLISAQHLCMDVISDSGSLLYWCDRLKRSKTFGSLETCLTFCTRDLRGNDPVCVWPRTVETFYVSDGLIRLFLFLTFVTLRCL